MKLDPAKVSVPLLQGQTFVDPSRTKVSRRVRMAPIAVTRLQSFGVTCLLARSHSNEFAVYRQAFVHHDEVWRFVGCDGAEPVENLLANRPPATELGGWVIQLGADNGIFGDGWGYVHLRTSAEAHTVIVQGLEHQVPRHGNVLAIVNWQSVLDCVAHGTHGPLPGGTPLEF